MATKDEKIRILKMIEDGKISTDQGIGLINSIDSSSANRTHNYCCEEDRPQTQAPHWLRVTVTDLGSGKKRVNIKIPAGLISTGSKMGAHFSTDIKNINPDQLKQYIRDGYFGRILDVIDEDESEHVEVFLE